MTTITETSEDPTTTPALVDTTTKGTEMATTTETSEDPSTTVAPVDTTTEGTEMTTTTEISEDPSTSEAPVNTTPDSIETTATITTGISEETSTTTDPFDVVCPESVDGLAVFVPHPTDCSKYYACQGSCPILMECPPGLFFDPSISVCNYPQFVQCSSTFL
jgi:chitinase